MSRDFQLQLARMSRHLPLLTSMSRDLPLLLFLVVPSCPLHTVFAPADVGVTFHVCLNGVFYLAATNATRSEPTMDIF